MITDDERRAGQKQDSGELEGHLPRTPTELIEQVIKALPPKFTMVGFEDPDDSFINWQIVRSAEGEPSSVSIRKRVKRDHPSGVRPQSTEISEEERHGQPTIVFIERGGYVPESREGKIAAGSLVDSALHALKRTGLKPNHEQASAPTQKL